MIVLIHDIKNIPEKAENYFKKFKDLKLVKEDEADDFFKSHWKEVKTVIDTTANKKMYKRCKLVNNENSEDKTFAKGVTFVEFKGRKIVNLFNLRNYFYKKSNFSEEEFNKITYQKQTIENTLSSICSVFQNNLEKELEEISDKPINIKEITLDKKDVYLVKELKKGEVAGENVIDVNDFVVLKELKEIFLHKMA